MGIKSASELIDYNYRQSGPICPGSRAHVTRIQQLCAAAAPGSTQQYSATAAACPRVISSLFCILSKPRVAACPSYRRVVSIRDVTAAP